ncbi:adhesion G-protein coupled receptor G1-like [Rhinophrynus dorsalis]
MSALLLLLLMLQGLVPGIYGFSLCGWRTQFAGGGFLQYRGGSREHTITVVNRLEALIVEGPYLPSTNITLQSIPGNYVFCVHWLPGLRTFSLKYGVHNYSWNVMDRSDGIENTSFVPIEYSCQPNTTIINMTMNGMKRNDSCHFSLQFQDWGNDPKLVEHEISAVSKYLEKTGFTNNGRMLRRWIDRTLSGVQFEGASRHFGDGLLQAAVFKLDSVDVINAIPKKMGIAVSLPKQLLQNGSHPKRLHVVSVREHSLFQDEANSTVLGDQVIGVSLENTKVSNLCEDIIFTFQHQPLQANFSPVCVFWNESTDGWSTYGCKTFPKGNHTQCNCNHLTYFAVLMQTSSQTISEDHLLSLSVLTFAGCTISAVAALFTICWHCCSRKMQSNPTVQIHMQLLGAVLLLDVSFMASAVLGAVGMPLLCKGSAILLHMAQLCTFTWMAIEGFNLYRLVVKVFDSSSLTTKKLALLGWGAPVLIVLTIILMDHDSYGSYNFKVDRSSSCNSSSSICWLTKPIIHYVVNLGFFATVFLFNNGMLIAMIRCVWHLTPHTRGEKVRHCATLLGLSCMLGLPWGLAFFSFGALYLPVQYIFSILNSLQGLFIFLWYWALSQPHARDPSRSSVSSSALPASPRTDQSSLMSDHKKLLT